MTESHTQGGRSPMNKVSNDTPVARTRVLMPHGSGYLMERMNNPKFPQNLGRIRPPGGGVEPGETPQQAAVREMKEELGVVLDPSKMRSLGIHTEADFGPEEYFQADEHGVTPGNYVASVGGDRNIELIEGSLDDEKYWGSKLDALLKRKGPDGVATLKQSADREDCPHCGALMERGDNGKCNRCGKDWPEKTAGEPSRSLLQPPRNIKGPLKIPEPTPINPAMTRAPSPMRGSIQSKIRSTAFNDPTPDIREPMVAAIKQQQSSPAEWESLTGNALLQRRHPGRTVLDDEDGFSNVGKARPGTGEAVVSKKPPKYPSDWTEKGQREGKLLEGLGRPTVANHELEHAYQQPRRYILPQTPGARFEASGQAKIDSERLQALQSQYDDAAVNGQWDKVDSIREQMRGTEESQAQGLQNNDFMDQHGEVGPTMGDLVFRAEQFTREEGKPLQHTVQLPGGKRHDINWMRQQAKQHGYWDGRPMHNLIFNTPEGRQWYNQMVEGEERGMGKMNTEKTAYDTCGRPRKHAGIGDIAKNIWKGVKFHAPRVRLLDTIGGAAVGGTAGLGLASLRNAAGDDEEKENRRYLTHGLAGALGGAGLGNLTGDRLRRYVSNSIDTSQYGHESQLSMLKPKSFSDFYRRAILDNPDENLGEGLDGVARNFWRASMDIPTREENTSIVLDAAGNTVVDIKSEAVKTIQPSNIFGKYRNPVGPDGKSRIVDRYDFDLHDNEKKQFKSMLGDLLSGQELKGRTVPRADVAEYYKRWRNKRFSSDVEGKKLFQAYLIRLLAQAALNTDGGVHVNIPDYWDKGSAMKNKKVATYLQKLAYGIGKVEDAQQKTAVDVQIGKRTQPVFHSHLEKKVMTPEERKAIDPGAGGDRIRNIAKHMTAARPEQLTNARLLSGNKATTDRLLKGLEDHAHLDNVLDRVTSKRDILAQELAAMPNSALQQFPSAYIHDANTAIVHTDSPGTVIHELGHAIDMQRNRSTNPTVRKVINAVKPTVLSEYLAWKRGRQAYQEGFAMSPDIERQAAIDEYISNMESYNRQKYPYFGTYVGGGAGLVSGFGLGGLAGLGAAAAMDAPSRVAGRLLGYGAVLGGALGGTTGIVAGGLLGRWWAKLREKKNKQRAVDQLVEARRRYLNKTQAQQPQTSVAQSKAAAAGTFSRDEVMHPQLTARHIENGYALLFKAAADTSSLYSEDLGVDMDSTGGLLADMFTPAAWGANRAGRATQLAKATGQDPGFNVSYPLTSSAAAIIGGGLVGGAAGALGGAGLTGGMGVVRAPLRGLFANAQGNPTLDSSIMGSIGGTLGGGLVGLFASAYLRRKKMREIAENFDQSGGEIMDNSHPEFSPWGYLGYAGGSHRQGQVEAHKALKNDTPVPGSVARALGNTVSQLSLEPVSHPIINLYRTNRARASQKEDAKANPRVTRGERKSRDDKPEDNKKAAFDWDNFQSKLKDTYTQFQGLSTPTRSLIGAGIGAGAGIGSYGLHSMMGGEDSNPSLLAHMGGGALAGGMAAGYAPDLSQYLAAMRASAEEASDAPAERQVAARQMPQASGRSMPPAVEPPSPSPPSGGSLYRNQQGSNDQPSIADTPRA